jgi:pimeloyl-ACP methyl ester carboxylesterase
LTGLQTLRILLADVQDTCKGRRAMRPFWRLSVAVVGLGCLLVPSLGAQDPSAVPGARFMEIEGRPVRVLAEGLEERGPGTPVVVFESGGASSLEAWSGVWPRVTDRAPVVAYDRAGLGESEWDEQTPTPGHVAHRLRLLLQRIGAEPPYVVVGHSWGGALVRYFAGHFPTEVAGIVYVDPGPIVTQSVAEELAPFEEVGAGTAGYEAFWSGYQALMEGVAPAVRAEFHVYRELMERDPEERGLRPVPEVPVVVIVAARPYPPLPGLPFDPEAHFEADLRHRIRKLQEWALDSPRGTMVLSNHTSHAVPREDPELIVWAVKRVLEAIP